MINDGYIDIHIHLIPDVDDGSANMRMSLSMLELARNEGITSFICTPHYGEFGKAARPREYVDSQFEYLKKYAAEQFPEIKLFRGNELFFCRDIPKKLGEGRACSMNGTDYLLVEFEPEERAKDVYDDLSFLIENGYKPILAHAERIFDLADNTKYVARLVESCVLLQVNAVSLTLERCKPFKKLARYMIEQRFASFIGTDAHGDDYRVPYYKPAVEWLYKKFDEAYVDGLVFGNVAKLLITDANC